MIFLLLASYSLLAILTIVVIVFAVYVKNMIVVVDTKLEEVIRKQNQNEAVDRKDLVELLGAVRQLVSAK